MATLNVKEGRGKGTWKMAASTVDIADGESIDTGFSSIESANLTVVDNSAGTAVVNIRSVSGGTVTVGSNTGGSNTVHYQIVGQSV